MASGKTFDAAEILAQHINTPASVTYEAGVPDRAFDTLPDALDHIRDHPAVDMKTALVLGAGSGTIVIEGNDLLALVAILPEPRV